MLKNISVKNKIMIFFVLAFYRFLYIIKVYIIGISKCENIQKSEILSDWNNLHKGYRILFEFFL
jgi:hypothetical protein